MCHPRCGPCEATGEFVTSKDAWAPDGFKKHIQGEKKFLFSLSNMLDPSMRLTIGQIYSVWLQTVGCGMRERG